MPLYRTVTINGICYPVQGYKSGFLERPGYHLRQISRGDLGEPSKIREEVEEFLDAVQQGVAVMALVELSDLLGAVEAYLKRYHPSIGIDDLLRMKEVTKRAFVNGHRTAK